jgi:hypothetical protein
MSRPARAVGAILVPASCDPGDELRSLAHDALAMVLHRHRRSRLDDAVLNAMAFAWLGRGIWRASRGRAPWRAASRR